MDGLSLSMQKPSCLSDATRESNHGRHKITKLVCQIEEDYRPLG